MAPVIVAPGRTVHHEGAYHGPGAQLEGMDTADVKRLTALGFLVDPDAEEPEPVVEPGTTVTTAEGPVVRAGRKAKAAASEA